jgi:hypothetical protein
VKGVGLGWGLLIKAGVGRLLWERHRKRNYKVQQEKNWERSWRKNQQKHQKKPWECRP